MRAPRGPKPARLAIAQLPANAAPNTSALIRIAALSTVSTFGQRMRRGREGGELSIGRPLQLSRVARGFGRQQAGLDQGGTDAFDLGATDFDQRRTYHRSRQAAE